MGAGDIKYIDRNDDKKIDAEDMTEIGDEFPHYPLLCLQNSMEGFDFSFMLQGVLDAQTRISGALAEGGNFEGFTLDISKITGLPKILMPGFHVRARVWIIIT
jgi:hypothetical protein